MTSVDTGWITHERPHPRNVRLAEEGFQAPLDLVDGAARVYDPVVPGEASDDVFGVFLKDYEPSVWRASGILGTARNKASSNQAPSHSGGGRIRSFTTAE